MGFRLVSTSMTLNGVTALILRFLTEFNSFALLNFFTVVENRPIMSVKYFVSQFQSYTFGQN